MGGGGARGGGDALRKQRLKKGGRIEKEIKEGKKEKPAGKRIQGGNEGREHRDRGRDTWRG